jgi:hypothetical protein
MDLNLQLDRLQKEGWCVIEGVIPDGEVSAVREQVAKATAEHGRSLAAERGIGHVPGFIAYDHFQADKSRWSRASSFAMSCA